MVVVFGGKSRVEFRIKGIRVEKVIHINQLAPFLK